MARLEVRPDRRRHRTRESLEAVPAVADQGPVVDPAAVWAGILGGAADGGSRMTAKARKNSES